MALQIPSPSSDEINWYHVTPESGSPNETTDVIFPLKDQKTGASPPRRWERRHAVSPSDFDIGELAESALRATSPRPLDYYVTPTPSDHTPPPSPSAGREAAPPAQTQQLGMDGERVLQHPGEQSDWSEFGVITYIGDQAAFQRYLLSYRGYSSLTPPGDTPTAESGWQPASGEPAKFEESRRRALKCADCAREFFNPTNLTNHHCWS